MGFRRMEMKTVRIMGFKSMEMKTVRGKGSRQETFSKGKNSLFKKATKLATLCAGGKPFSFGHPHIDSVAQRFLTQESLRPKPVHVDDPKEAGVQELNQYELN